VINAFKAGLNDGAIPPYRDLLKNYCFARALVIDDLGLGSTGTDWEYSQLEEIIDVRYDRRLLTLLATNKHLNELPARVVSRFRDPDVGIIVLNSARDYRKR
jgi:DNA replication protein DnaC